MFKKFFVLATALVFTSSVFASGKSNRLSGEDVVTDVTIAQGATPIRVVGVATGAAGVIRVHPNGDGQTFDYKLYVVRAGSPITAVHLHLGPEGVNGPVLGTLCDNAGAAACPSNNAENVFALTGTFNAADITLIPEIGIGSIDDLKANAKRGNIYIDVHSESFPDGEVRGALKVEFSEGRDDDDDSSDDKDDDDDDSSSSSSSSSNSSSSSSSSSNS